MHIICFVVTSQNKLLKKLLLLEVYPMHDLSEKHKQELILVQSDIHAWLPLSVPALIMTLFSALHSSSSYTTS